MTTVTTGTFFLARQRAVTTTRDAAGAFRLRLRVIDHQGTGITEAYVVTWTGPDAQAWHAEHQADLIPGRGLRLELVNPRSMPGLHAPETHATVTRCALAPLAPSWQARPAGQHHHQAQA